MISCWLDWKLVSEVHTQRQAWLTDRVEHAQSLKYGDRLL